MQSFRTYRTFLGAIAVLFFLLLGTAGVPAFGMDMQQGGHMSGCPFMGEGAICNMNPLEHLAAWQSAFTTTVPERNLLSSLLLLLGSLFALQMWRKIIPHNKDPLLQPFRVRYRERVFYPNPLQEAFSNGILNPKVF